MGGEIRGGDGGLGGERIEEYKGETVLPTTKNVETLKPEMTTSSS